MNPKKFFRGFPLIEGGILLLRLVIVRLIVHIKDILKAYFRHIGKYMKYRKIK